MSHLEEADAVGFVTEGDDETSRLFSKLSLDSREDNAKNKDLLSRMQELECPFTWNLEHSDESRIIAQVREKLTRTDDVEDEMLKPWKRLVLCIILCYEYTKNDEFDEAQEQVEECEHILQNSKGAVPEHVSVIGSGLEHILKACICFLNVEMHAHQDARAKLNEITPFKQLDTKQQASIWSFRAAFYMEYGYWGIKESVIFIEKALDMDKSCGQSHFLLGKALGRVRRIENATGIPDKRELEALEMAVKITERPCLMVLLAQAYRETSRSVYFEKETDLKTFKPYCDSLNNKSAEYYRRALANGKNYAYINVRCALGFMKFPKPWQDLKTAKLCVDKSLELAPDNLLVIHAAGTYYKLVNDVRKAKQYLAKAAENGNFGASMDLTVLKLKENRHYNPVPDLERMLSRTTEKPFKHEILCQIGSYYFFCKKDFRNALQYWKQVIDEDIDSEKLKRHRPSFIPRSRVCDLRRIIVTEISHIKFSSTREKKEMENLKRTLYEKT